MVLCAAAGRTKSNDANATSATPSARTGLAAPTVVSVVAFPRGGGRALPEDATGAGVLAVHVARTLAHEFAGRDVAAVDDGPVARRDTAAARIVAAVVRIGPDDGTARNHVVAA